MVYYIKKNNTILAVIRRLVAEMRRDDRMLKDLPNEWRRTWRIRRWISYD